ncbi:acyl-CoA dehydrogenase family protein [Actinomadura scrupuli]|uniref:acyl-CoA dehydrogenase family protein n=1 Tax=Actinomadura scrupuli TaxID=559629 RepID=UPI003D986983
MTDLLYGDDENDLRSAARALLEDRAPWPSVLARTETDEPYDPKLWRSLATELGCAGLAVPEELGGAGASWREAAVVAEELGRAVAPVPFLGSAVIATAALLAAGDPDLTGELAAGARTAALAVPFSTDPHAPYPATVTAEGDVLTGTVRSVADALPADVLLVPAGGDLYAVEASAVTRTPVVSLDMTRRLCDLRFTAAPARPVARGETAVRAGLLTGAAVLASEQLGLAERCLEITVEYLKTRYQFGRPIGSYQGLKHRLADLWVAITQARAVARYAAACAADGDPDTPVAVAVAQAHCSAVAVRAAEECVQMHGGIGFTWEHPAHLFLKRAKSTAIALGTPDRHRAALAGLVDLPG